MSAPREPISRPTLEDLLRLKRAERPDAAFWSDFDQGLRQKQLAAIVEPKPWWLGLSLIVRRFALPAGAVSGVSAAAAALFAIIALTPSEEPMRDSNGRLANAAVEISALDSKKTAAAPLGYSKPEPTEMIAGQISVAAEPASFYDQSAARDHQDLLAERSSLPVGLSSQPTSSVNVESKGDILSITLASVGLKSNLLFASAPVTGEVTATTVISPLDPNAVSALVGTESTMLATSTNEFGSALEIPATLSALPDRQARLLAASSLPTAETGAVIRTRERIVRHLSDSDELYASVTRLGVRGDRLSVRF